MGWWRGRSGTSGPHAHGAARGHMKGYAARPGTAVVEEGDRPRLRIAHAIERVTHVEDAAGGLLFFIGYQERARDGAVVQRLAIKREFVLRNRTALWRNGSYIAGSRGSGLII